MLDLNNPELQFAIHATRKASVIVKKIQQSLVIDSISKEDRSPVTVADFASQALISHQLQILFPNDCLVGEENSSVLRQPEQHSLLEQITSYVSEFVPQAQPLDVCDWIDYGNQSPDSHRFWTLDPVDGTKGFLRGDQFVVALALIENNQIKIGVLGCPNLSATCQPSQNGEGILVAAARGQGSWVMPLNEKGNFEPMQLFTSSINKTEYARILRSFEDSHTNTEKIDQFIAQMGVQHNPIKMDGQTKYVLLASGHGELLLRLISEQRPDYHECIWDQAAGWIIITEAGGEVTDLDGKQLDFSTGRRLLNNRGVLASNKHLHSEALKTLRNIQA